MQSIVGRLKPRDDYWHAMVPSHRPGRALLLGLGAGTVARLLVDRFGAIPIVGVDDDPSVIALTQGALNDMPSLEIVQQDAFEYVAAATDRFDLACVDLYRGAQIQAGIIHRPFLRQLRSLLEPRGLAVFNLAQDRETDTRITRMGRVFRVLRTEQIAKNVVVWCR